MKARISLVFHPCPARLHNGVVAYENEVACARAPTCVSVGGIITPCGLASLDHANLLKISWFTCWIVWYASVFENLSGSDGMVVDRMCKVCDATCCQASSISL